MQSKAEKNVTVSHTHQVHDRTLYQSGQTKKKKKEKKTDKTAKA